MSWTSKMNSLWDDCHVRVLHNCTMRYIMRSYWEGEAIFSKASHIHVWYITGSIFSSSVHNCFQIENIPTRSCFFYLEMCLYEVPVCWMLLNQLIFWKIGLSIIQKTPYLCVSYINLTVISSSIQSWLRLLCGVVGHLNWNMQI